MLGYLPPLGRGALVACALALLLAGCGRKGPLEPPPAAPQANAPNPIGPGERSLVGNSTNLSEGGFQDANGDPGLIQSPNYVYERSAIAKLNAATTAPAPRPINAPPLATPNTFLLDPLVK